MENNVFTENISRIIIVMHVRDESNIKSYWWQDYIEKQRR